MRCESYTMQKCVSTFLVEQVTTILDTILDVHDHSKQLSEVYDFSVYMVLDDSSKQTVIPYLNFDTSNFDSSPTIQRISETTLREFAAVRPYMTYDILKQTHYYEPFVEVRFYLTCHGT